ncbi:Potassium voltage-gated channel sub KQT member 4 [Dermatophagoides pteronyssinus]|uniref:Potassium voltage-gated channel sub KQT member 4 n=1 Tax=Dermatophagoides pteronyssinus TaxID=6956 RepID=A0ABQ8J8P1_DERPT|nr:Potassium voltage-gated channel sub KQT member 4 [Dermatophagoides pteronyssinus]
MFEFHQPLLVRLINTPRNKYVVYMFLHVPRHWLSICYQIFMMMLITVCILVTMFMQINVGSQTEYIVLFWLDLSCLIIFCSEFILNVWSSTVLPQYSGPYGIYWMLINPLYIIDMLVIGVTIADVAMDCVWLPLAAGLRGFRMIWFLQNRFVMIRLLWKAIWSERFQLMVSIYYCAVWVFSFGFLMYFIEQPFNDYFNTVANSVWWAVVTFTTVGYGNAAPITTAGKIVTAFAMILGVWLFGLPAGIVGAALALKCEEECSMAGTLRQNFGAAMVQNAWRVYRICKEEQRRQEDDPPLLVRISSINHSLQFTSQPNVPSSDMHEYFNPIAVKFVFLLKHAYYKRKFITSEEINDSKNFYATYMQTSWQQTNMLLNIHSKIDHLWDSMTEARLQIETLKQQEQQPPQRQRRSIASDHDGNDDDNQPPPPPGDDGQSGGQNDLPSDRRTSETTVKSSNHSVVDNKFTVKDSPFLLLKQNGIPLKRLLRRQIQCWNCLYRKHLKRNHRKSTELDDNEQQQQQQETETPQLLLDLSTPRSSQHDLLL